jgi:23S rRNA A2030 N6-methylase RlmJ
MNDDPGVAPEPELPASPRRDQMIVRLRDLERLRELTEPYVTDSGAGYREDALTRMPAAERGEAEEIIARIGTRDPTLATLQDKLLGLIAEMNVFYRDVLDRERARGADPEDLRQAQEILTALERYRNQITGLKPGDTD